MGRWLGCVFPSLFLEIIFVLNDLFTPRTDIHNNRFPLDGLDISGQIDDLYDLYMIACVAGWDMFCMIYASHVCLNWICVFYRCRTTSILGEVRT